MTQSLLAPTKCGLCEVELDNVTTGIEIVADLSGNQHKLCSDCAEFMETKYDWKILMRQKGLTNDSRD